MLLLNTQEYNNNFVQHGVLYYIKKQIIIV